MGVKTKSVKQRLDRNLLSAKYFHKIIYRQTTTNQTKINEWKTICLLGWFFFFVFFVVFFLKKFNLPQM